MPMWAWGGAERAERKRLRKVLADYVKAAESGDVGAMRDAACWYRDGTAGQVDLVQAARWYIVMLRHGNGDGVHEIFQFAREMTPEQLREAARLAGDPAAAENFLRVLGR